MDSLDNDYGRIHRVAFKAVISILFIVPMLATISRLSIRFRYQKRLLADDYVLLLGCSTLIGAFTLVNVMYEDIYFDMFIILGPAEQVYQVSTSPGFVKRIFHYQQLAFSAETLCWVTIYSVKISYLLFFRQLLDRLERLMTYWRITLGIVVISGLFCISSIFISCPHFGVSSVECAQGIGFTRTIAISQSANVLNMFTDILIVAVPISLLWKVNVRLGQKFVLGTFLCLSICMFAICLMRTSSLTIYGNSGTTVDVQWLIFWQTIEASVAVTVVSLTTFRSLYGIKTLQQEHKNKRPNGTWLSYYRKKRSNRKKQRMVDELGNPISDEDSSQLPSIPGATLTGMRTLIGGVRVKSPLPVSGRDGLLSVDEALDKEVPGSIKVVHEFDVHQSVRSYV